MPLRCETKFTEVKAYEELIKLCNSKKRFNDLVFDCIKVKHSCSHRQQLSI